MAYSNNCGRFAQSTVRPDIVIDILPGRQHGSNLRERSEQRLVEEFVAQPGVEKARRNEGILGRLARVRSSATRSVCLAKAQHGHSGQLGSVLSDTHAGRPRQAMMTSSSRTTRRPGSEVSAASAEALAGEVVDYGQNAGNVGHRRRHPTENRGSSAGWLPAGSPAAPWVLNRPFCAHYADELAAVPRDKDDEISCGS